MVPDETDYPLGRDQLAPFRANRIAALVGSRAQLGAADFQAIQADRYDISTESLLRYLVALNVDPGDARHAQSLLRTWDGKMGRGAAPALYQAFYVRLLANTFQDDVETPSIQISWTSSKWGFRVASTRSSTTPTPYGGTIAPRLRWKIAKRFSCRASGSHRSPRDSPRSRSIWMGLGDSTRGFVRAPSGTATPAQLDIQPRPFAFRRLDLHHRERNGFTQRSVRRPSRDLTASSDGRWKLECDELGGPHRSIGPPFESPLFRPEWRLANRSQPSSVIRSCADRRSSGRSPRPQPLAASPALVGRRLGREDAASGLASVGGVMVDPQPTSFATHQDIRYPALPGEVDVMNSAVHLHLVVDNGHVTEERHLRLKNSGF